MKYKIEFWPYGEFETMEAADRLNKRAAAGWELVNITGGSTDINTNHVMWRCVLYRRNPAAAGFRYTADIVSLRDGDAYIDFCRDSGWEKVIQLNSGMCIFLSRDGSGKPLHTSREVEFEHQLQVLSENHVTTEAAVYLIYFAVVCGFLGWMWHFAMQGGGSGINVMLYFIPAYAVLWLKEALIYSINLLYIKYARYRVETGMVVKRPGWMRWISGLFSVLDAGIMVYAVIFVGVISLTEGAAPAAVIVSLLMFLTLTAAGIWVQLFKNKMGLGTGLNLAGLCFCIVPILFG